MQETGVEMEGRDTGLPASRLARLAVAAAEHKLVLAAQRFPDPWQQVAAGGVVEVRHPVSRLDPHLPRHLVIDVRVVGTIGDRTEAGRRTGKVIEQARSRVIWLLRQHKPRPRNTGRRKIEARRRAASRRVRSEDWKKCARAAKSAQQDR